MPSQFKEAIEALAVKQPYEVVTWGIDLTGICQEGVSVSSTLPATPIVIATVSAPTVSLNSTMLVGTPSVADNIFSFVVQAGTSGEKYTARIKVDLSNNDKREIDFPFSVSEL
jgi:hypothetical protein